VRKAPIATIRACHSPTTTLFDAEHANLNPGWLSDLKKRVGYCIGFGLSSSQVEEAGSILKEVANDWRELMAGSEGFLTGPERRGFFKQEVTWGETVSVDI
jgi:hypothetical protein